MPLNFLSRASNPGDGATVDFSIPFPYLLQSQVLVYVRADEDADGVLQTVGTDYTWTSPGIIQFVTAPVAGSLVDRIRSSGITSVVARLTAPATLSSAQLNAIDTQLFYLVQEVDDTLTDLLARAIQVPDGEILSGTLPGVSERAGSTLIFDAEGNPAVALFDLPDLAALGLGKPLGSVYPWQLYAVLRSNYNFDIHANAPEGTANAAAFDEYMDREPITPGDALATYIQTVSGLSSDAMAFAFTAAGVVRTVVTPSSAVGFLLAVSTQKILNGPTGWVEAMFPGLISLATQAAFASPNGGYGLLGASRSSDAGAGNPNSDSTAGVIALGVADNELVTTSVHDLYAEMRRLVAACYAPGLEVAIVNADSIVDSDPFTAIPLGVSSALWASCGRGDVDGSTDATTFLTIVPGIAGQFRKGIVVAEAALSAIYNEFLSLPTEVGIVWRTSSGGSVTSLQGAQFAHTSRSATTAFVSNFIRQNVFDAGLGYGGDTVNGMELARLNGFQTVANVPQQRAALAMRRESQARGSAYFECLNEASQVVQVGFNNIANNTFGANVDGLLYLGAPTYRLAGGYSTTAISVSCDAALKMASLETPKAWVDTPQGICDAVLATPLRRVKLIDSVERKGRAALAATTPDPTEEQILAAGFPLARWHNVPIAQELQANLTAAGFDPFAENLLGRDEWWVDEVVMVDEEQPLQVTVKKLHTRYVIANGVATQVTDTVDELVDDTEDVPVVDSAGKPIMEPERMLKPGEQGPIPMRQKVIKSVKMQTVKVPTVVKVRKLDDQGNPAFLLNVNDEFYAVRAEAIRRKLAALETK